MAPAHYGRRPHHKYGSVDDTEQPTAYSSLLHRSPECSITRKDFPATVGKQQHPTQQDTPYLRDPEKGKSVAWKLAVVTVVCGLAFLAGIGVSLSRTSGSRSTAATTGRFFEVGANTGIPAAEIQPSEPSSVVVSHDSHGVTDLEFTALNFYHVRDGKPGQDYPWLKNVKLIEPHRDTTLAVVGPREGFDYRWEVRAGSSSGSGGVGDVQATATGAVTIVVLTQLDENVIVLEEVDGDGRVTNRLEETVMVKYVRREIRTLTDDEKEELLDAMFQLWSVRMDDGNGEELYGEDYADVYALSRIHYMATTNDTCDHFHDGLGFLVSHSLITNTFEFSLQLVNPKLTVPYWDFTIETTSATELEYDPSQPNTRTELMSSSWFGTTDLSDGMVKDSRWAYLEIPKDKENNPGEIETDIYGKLRSPWTTNDRAYLSRGLGEVCQVKVDEYLDWPNCQIHYDLTTQNSDFYSWVWDSMGDPHGPIHLWLGGVMDCKSMYNKISSLVGPDIAAVLAFLGVGHRRSLFCEGVWSCEGDKVTVDVKPEELLSSGTCGCHGYDLTQGDDYKLVIPEFSYLEFYIGEFSEDVQRQVVEALCSGVIALGDMDQSSSSFDPMFWAVHPTMERLWQFAVVTDQVKSFNWADSDVNITLPDGTTTTEYISTYYDTCFGHHGSDIFPFGLLDKDVDGFEVKTGIRSNPVKGNNLSNREVLEALNLRSNSLAYVYDTFKWDHCVPEGYNFDDAWGESTSSPRKNFFETDGPQLAVYTSFKRKMAELMNGKTTH